jgi:dihydropyrimidinase/allantoinase
MVPIIISEGYNKGRLSLQKTVEVLSTNAAKQYGLYPKKGAMFIGSDADFSIIDLEKEWTLDAEKQVTLAKYNPMHGMKLKGKPVKTVVRGTLVYDGSQEGVLPTLEDYSMVFATKEENQSAEFKRSHRINHPEEVEAEMREIKGIMVKPGFGNFTKRQNIQRLERTITF